MTKKSEAANNGGNVNLTIESGLESMISAVEQRVPQPERPEGTNPSLKKGKSSMANQGALKKKVNRFYVRRSERIQNSYPCRNHKVQKVIEEITLSESDEEDELPADNEKNLAPTNQEKALPELMVEEKNMEGKINHLVQLLEAQGHTINSLKNGIEELTEENQGLSQKLENALDQCEAYKKAVQEAFEVMNKLKDGILISSVSKVSEAVNEKTVSPNAGDVPSAKRKKLTEKKLK